MSSTTITAEGGTIKLTTAESGEVTAVSSDFSVTVVQQVVGGANSVTEYATLAALITASEGTLAAGYYEVAEAPPVTHPLYPRIVTYWDGAAFEPQISTGFEARPTLAGEYATWDALEGQYRTRPSVGQLVAFLPNLVSAGAAEGLSNPTGSTLNTYFRGAICEVVDEGGSAADAFQYFNAGADPTAGTIVLAGSDLRGAATANSVIAGVGSTAADLGISIFNWAASSEQWGVGWWSASDNSAVAPRSTGDVVILSYDATSYDLWVNGTKLLTRTTAMTIAVQPRRALIFADQSGVYNSHGGKISFVDFSSTRIDDTAAAAWTAWLQARYGIPTL